MTVERAGSWGLSGSGWEVGVAAAYSVGKGVDLVEAEVGADVRDSLEESVH